MTSTTHGLFHSAYGLRLTVEQVVAEIIGFMEQDRTRRYKLIIGTDSQLSTDTGSRQSGKADFVTAIVIHRVGNGGRYFWRHLGYQRIPTLRHRIYQEVSYSIEVALELFEYCKDMTPLLDFEIHVDVGENGETKTMLNELIGMVRAHNFEAKTKPESFAASKVADRHV